MSEKRFLSIETNLDELDRIQDTVAELAELGNWSPDFVYQVSLVLEELIVNIVNYGHDDDVRHEIEIALTSTADAFTIEIEDDGHAFNPLRDAPEPDLNAALKDRPVGGLGIYLVCNMMDELHYRRVRDRNLLTLIKRRNG